VPDHVRAAGGVRSTAGYRQINLELETERITLEPCESFEISYSFEPWDGVSY
jgi:hypothetical protein